MIFSLAVYAAPYSHQGALTALEFAKAALTNGHTIRRVFFYQDGVYNASLLNTPPQGEINVTESWAALASTHRIELVVCIAAALRRGILDATESERYEKSAHNLHPQFLLAGLGQLIETAVESDQLITFGA